MPTTAPRRSARPGSGEVFIRAAAAHELCARVRIGGAELQEALDAVLAEVKALGGNGGLIAVAPSGEAAWGFTTPGMYRGMAGPEGRAGRGLSTRSRSGRAAPPAPIPAPAAIASRSPIEEVARRPRGSRGRAGNGPSG